MVVTARKSERTLSEANPTANPSRPARYDRKKNSQNRIADPDHRQGCRIGAGAEEGAVPEADLPAKAADHVEADGEYDVDADHRENADLVGAHAARKPVNPSGRIIKIAIRARNAMASRSSQAPMKIVP